MSWNDPRDLKIDPFGILIGHTWGEVGLILDTLNKYNVMRFVEIGVHKGGLATMLAVHALYNLNFQYLGVEIDREIVDSRVVVEIENMPHCKLLFADALGEHAEVSIHHFVQGSHGTALIYCDGGNKAAEFKMYAHHLRGGDLIAAHDFDFGGYERAEISRFDVASMIEERNLENLTFGAPYRIALARKR